VGVEFETTSSTPSDVPDVLAPVLKVVLRSIPLVPQDAGVARR
jgi:hypothetical protein